MATPDEDSCVPVGAGRKRACEAFGGFGPGCGRHSLAQAAG